MCRVILITNIMMQRDYTESQSTVHLNMYLMKDHFSVLNLNLLRKLLGKKDISCLYRLQQNFHHVTIYTAILKAVRIKF